MDKDAARTLSFKSSTMLFGAEVKVGNQEGVVG